MRRTKFAMRLRSFTGKNETKRKIVRRSAKDLIDRRELARAKRRNAGKAGTDWESVKKEFGFDF